MHVCDRSPGNCVMETKGSGSWQTRSCPRACALVLQTKGDGSFSPGGWEAPNHLGSPAISWA